MNAAQSRSEFSVPINVVVRFIGPTNTKGARLVARSGDRRIVVAYDHSSNKPQRDAAVALLQRMGYNPFSTDRVLRFAGQLPGCADWVFVMLDM